jgi:hypothetical protein
MRTLLVLSVLALATPAAAQLNQFQIDDLRAQQQAAERRAIDQANQIQALETRLRADQASADLATLRAGARAPTLRYGDPTVAPGAAATAKYPSMPDATLADSNRRVQDAARNRR